MSSAERASDRLATWLDGLGLLDQLADAGLPQLTRGADGLAYWTRRGTGEPLTEPEVLELESSLRSQGEEPEHAVPVALVLLARRARIRKALAESPTHDYASLAALRGVSENATRFAVTKAFTAHELLVVVAGARTLVPAFQLDAAGAVRPELVDVIRPLLAAGMDPWNAWAWLTQPVALLGGEIPERLAAEPEEAALVAHAATRLARRVAADPSAPVKPVEQVAPPSAVPGAGAGPGCGCGGHH